MQTRYSDEYVDLDGNGYGVIFETGPINPTSRWLRPLARRPATGS